MAVRVCRFSYTSFTDAIKSFEKVDEQTGEFYFAIVDKCKDTIYASQDLKSWIVKENGKSIFYKYPEIPKHTTDTTFITDILKAEPFLRDWNCDSRIAR
jgi:hypothetical protein